MASKYTRTFCYEALTPDGHVSSGEAVFMMVPAPDGELGILAGRAPLVALLSGGIMLVQSADGSEQKFYVAGGYVHVRDNGVTVLAEECVPADWIDAEEAWQELQQAKARVVTTETEVEARDLAVRAARTKFNLAQQKRRGVAQQTQA